MDKRLEPLAEVASQLDDDALNDVMLYVAYLKIRARLFGLLNIAAQLRMQSDGAYCRCDEPAIAKHNGSKLCVLCLLPPRS